MKKKFIILASLATLIVGCSLFREDCETCNGTGKIVSFGGIQITCPDCNGKGYK
jgi:DnaJ-class molecular chaperone